MLLVCLGTMSASASTLLNDIVAINLKADANYGSFVKTVGAGAEATYFSALSVDMNAGAGGDLLQISSTRSASSIDETNLFPVVWTFSLLNFSDGSVLSGFEVITSAFSDLVVDFGPDWLTLSYADATVPEGTLISGRFITTPVTQAIPLPAPALLVLTGIAGLAAVGRRKRSA
ncbi:VPLPA-CTERM sorting domain-containing protein [Roseibium aestuarii]|uniref:VPLPA-CTERM sorting domain-containing protein n=1 Tax=Roseibium aestuarii TaxID=2600299 RepID=A0ABW4JY82_9HYPH|nr:VPLPA-CTERM sorting domain-containing protein [Roseibium aestuarii]